MTQEKTMSVNDWTKTDETGVYEKGGRYRVRVSAIDPDDGERKDRQRTLPEGATLEEAVEARQSLKDEIETPTRSPQRSTILSYAKDWLKRKKSEGLAPSTIEDYRHALSQWILPRVGHLDWGDFERSHVLQWIEWAESRTRDDGSPYSTNTVRGQWRVFRNLLRDAWADGHLERDVTQRVPSISTGRSGVREEGTLTADELGDVVEAAREHTPRRYPEIVTLAYTGMRSGELWALRWEDVDHDLGVIHVRRSVSVDEVRDRTKTGVDREVPMPEIVSEAILEHREWLLGRQDGRIETGLVFPSQAGTPRQSGSLRKACRKINDAVGLDVHLSPQVLRRTWNTLMVKSEVDRLVGRSIIGHADEEMTEHYAGIGIDEKRDAITRIFDATGGDSH